MALSSTHHYFSILQADLYISVLEVFHELAGLPLDFGGRSLNLADEFTICESLEAILGG